MTRRLIPLLVLALTAGLLAAGCGDDDETTATTGPTGATGATSGGEPLSKQAFIKQADAICKSGDEEIDQEAQDTFGTSQPSDQEVTDFAEQTVIPNIQDQIDQLRQLTPPEGDEDEVNAILDAAQNGIDELEADPSKAAQGNDAGGAFTEANQLAKQYGLSDCGGG